MKLRGIEFGPCWDAAGVRGFMGEGYWFHRAPLVRRWFDFEGSTRVAKTTTLPPNKGNMPLDRNLRPVELFPKCIWVSWRRGMALNAVGLSGPGAEALFDDGLLDQRYGNPFQISFMSNRETARERIQECKIFVGLLKARLRMWPALRNVLGLQINLSCPNTGLDPSELISEAAEMLDIAAELEIPIIIKINLLAPMDAVAQIAGHPECDAICITNTVPFGKLPEHIPWNEWFPDGSPLKKRGYAEGGLSGAPLLDLLVAWLVQSTMYDIRVPLNAGGGILEPLDVDILHRAGLRAGIDSIFIGSIAFLRPWNIRPVIRRADELLGSHSVGKPFREAA